ncbi:MAG TPA: helical backbone metal receptor, partial [Planctomycetota bacterium]|nr:helical backbone metal receptor [Planctomycetota bacterium]
MRAPSRWLRNPALVFLAPLALGLVATIVAVNAVRARPPRAAAPPGPPRRIVSLAPSITEVLFAIGAGDRVVGVTSHCDYPADVTTRARVGGYNAPNIELILDAHPDLVLVPQEGAIFGAYERLRSLGLRVEPVAVTCLADLEGAIMRAGSLVGRPAEAGALANDLRRRAIAVEPAVAGR